jgi:glucose/arabinose dehydrogenase
MHGVFFHLEIYEFRHNGVYLNSLNFLYPYMRRLAFILFIALIVIEHNAAAADQCNGLPQARAKTPKYFCVGTIATGFKAPRAVLPLSNGDLIVSDMGSWEQNQGAILRLHRDAGTYVRSVVADKLDRPNALALGPDGQVYATLAQRVIRFDPDASKPGLVDVIGGAASTPRLPSRGRHVLSGLVFDKQGNLFVSVGSASDHCEAEDGTAPAAGKCSESEGPQALGTLRKYTMQWPAGTVKSWETYATGLRNAMALAVDPISGKLWQGENARDSIQLAMPALKNDNELPHDELNVIEKGAHYGWPYCYDANLASPEYATARCQAYRAPKRLLPAHAAPLGMLFYRSAGFPPRFNHSLVVTYHGYRQHGHRIVALLADRAGHPLGRSVDLVIGTRTRGTTAVMAPVGITQGHDGDLYFADDHARAIFKLHYDAPTQ